MKDYKFFHRMQIFKIFLVVCSYR